MKRNIVRIDEEKCNGCGLCLAACHEGALELVNGVARLVSASYCDGLGDCLPECPTGAISIEEREAAPFDEEAVKQHTQSLPCGCPGQQSKMMRQSGDTDKGQPTSEPIRSELVQWPCQIRLVPATAPYFRQAHLLIAADCTAYAYANFHQRFMSGRVTLIGCPKLDDTDYTEKFTEILKRNDIQSVTVIQMEVPCCAGIVHAVKRSLLASQKMVPWNLITIATDGTIVEP